jgi:hypothetical protein
MGSNSFWASSKLQALKVRVATPARLGGFAVIQHYVLRLNMWRMGYTPFNYVKFLDHCAKLIFLKKVGGGYIFTSSSTGCCSIY